MLPYDPTGRKGPKTPLPDVVKVLKPKKDDLVIPPAATSSAPAAPAAPAPAQFDEEDQPGTADQ